MKKIILLLFLFQSAGLTQLNDLHSPENIKLFADFLFCEKDYLRAALEYEKYLAVVEDDTTLFKKGLAYSITGDREKAEEIFDSFNSESFFYNDSRLQYYKALFLSGDLKNFRDISGEEKEEFIPVKKLYNYSFLFEKTLPEFNEFIKPFEEEREKVSELYKRKKNPEKKNSTTAALLSAVIPGAGKIYTEEYGDGITAFLVTGVFAYLAYANFEADHKFRGWLFAGIGTLFYAGNIYGSAASAQIYNARIEFDLQSEINLYLEKKNYFLGDYDFCR